MAERGAVYTLKVLLTLNDKLSGGLNKSVSALKKFGKQSTSSLKHYDSLRKSLNKGVSVSPLTRYDAKLKSVTKDSRAAASAADRLNRSISKPVNTAGLDSALRKVRAVRRASEDAAAARPSAGGTPTDNVIPFPRRRRGGRRGLLGRADDVDSVFDAGRQVTQGWRDRVDSLRNFTDETTKLYRAQAQVRVIGLPEADNQRLFEAARNVTTQVKGITLADATQNALDLVGALGDVNQTIRALPLASKYKVGFETIFGDQFSPEQVNEQVRSSFKFLELTGKTQRGEEEMSRTLDMLSQINASTGGRVTPTDLLLMARRGSPAVQSLSAGGLRNVSTLIEDMGAEQTGTALSALYRSLVSGVMKQSSAERFDYYGLLDRSKIKFGKAQQIKRLLPGANLLGPMLQEDPLKAADELTQRMKAKGVDTTDERAVQAELSVLFQNQNAFRLMNQLINQRSQIAKEAGRSEQSKGVVSMYGQMQGDPLLKLKEAEAAWKNLKAEMGKPVLDSLAGMAQGLMPVAKFFGDHPTITKWTGAVLIGGKALGGLVETAALLHGGTRGVAGWLAGTSAESARLSRIIDETTGSLGRAGTSMDTTAAKAGKLKGQLGAISAMSAIKLTIGLAAVGAGVEIISWIIEENKKRTAEENRRKAVLGASYEGGVQQRQLFTTRTEADKNREALETIATQSYDVIRMMPEFKRGIQPEYTQGGKFSIYEAATKVRTTQTALADPNVLARLVKAIEQGKTGTTPEEGTRFKEILSIAFPEQFKVASNIIVEELASATKPLAESFSNLRRPTDELAPALFRLRSALESTAGRIGSLKFEPPTYGNLFGPPSPSPSPSFGSPNTGTKPLPFSSPLVFPSKASGGIVERGGFVQVHDAEAIIPAKVTRRWKETTTPAVATLPRSVKANAQLSAPRAAPPPPVVNEPDRSNAFFTAKVSRRTSSRRLERADALPERGDRRAESAVSRTRRYPLAAGTVKARGDSAFASTSRRGRTSGVWLESEDVLTGGRRVGARSGTSPTPYYALPTAAARGDNAIMPALARRRPAGDRLESAEALGDAGGDLFDGYDQLGGVTYSPSYQISVSDAAGVEAALAELERRHAAERAALRAEMMSKLNSARRFRRQLSGAESHRRQVA